MQCGAPSAAQELATGSHTPAPTCRAATGRASSTRAEDPRLVHGPSPCSGSASHTGRQEGDGEGEEPPRGSTAEAWFVAIKTLLDKPLQRILSKMTPFHS